jgi:hypothetical protein
MFRSVDDHLRKVLLANMLETTTTMFDDADKQILLKIIIY